MKRIALIVCFVGIVAVLYAKSRPPEKPCQDCEALIRDAIHAVNDIKAGANRDSLYRNFEEDGGLQTAGSGRYVFRKCRFIKIDVEFKASDGTEPRMHPAPDVFAPTDVVAHVSRPYLEYPATD